MEKRTRVLYEVLNFTLEFNSYKLRRRSVTFRDWILNAMDDYRGQSLYKPIEDQKAKASSSQDCLRELTDCKHYPYASNDVKPDMKISNKRSDYFLTEMKARSMHMELKKSDDALFPGRVPSQTASNVDADLDAQNHSKKSRRAKTKRSKRSLSKADKEETDVPTICERPKNAELKGKKSLENQKKNAKTPKARSRSSNGPGQPKHEKPPSERKSPDKRQNEQN